MGLFRLESSIRTEGSISREVADVVEDAWARDRPGDRVVRRDIGLAPAAVGRVGRRRRAVPYARRTRGRPSSAGRGVGRDTGRRAAGRPDGADRRPALQLRGARPPQGVDRPRHHRSAVRPGSRPLEGRPVVLVAVRGGGYGAGTPREGWDHATPYLLRILRDVWGADVTLVEAELTLADVHPAAGRAARRRRRLPGARPVRRRRRWVARTPR